MNDEIISLLKIIRHKNKVSRYLINISNVLLERALTHDDSKFEIDEFEGFYQLDTRRNHQKEEYGSKAYEDGIAQIDAVKLHQSRNSHHPEFYPGGIRDMSLFDIIEMLCDWEVARQQRDTEQDINTTWKVRQDRFKLNDFEISFLRLLWEKINL